MESKIKLFDVLHNKTAGGYSREAFTRFLRNRNAENLLEFWVVVQDYHNYFEPQNVESTYSKFGLKLPVDTHTSAVRAQKRRDKLEEARVIMATYCFEDAPLKVNLSQDVRNAIIEKLPNDSTIKEAPEMLFNDAQQEIKELMKTDHFDEFIAYAPKLHAKMLAHTGQTTFHVPRPPKKDESKILLKDVLHNKTSGGYSRSYLKEFLEEKYSEGLLEFWVVIQAYWDLYEPTCVNSSYSLFNIPMPKQNKRSKAKKRKEKLRTAREIIQTYILEDSALQVNLSAQQRTFIESKLPLEGDKVKVPNNLFLDAQLEVYLLLESNYFTEFLDWGPELYELRSREQQELVVFTPRPPSTRLAMAIGEDEATYAGSFVESVVESLETAIQGNKRVASIRLRHGTSAGMGSLERVKFQRQDLLKEE